MTGIVAHTYPEWWLKLTGQAAHWSTDYSREMCNLSVGVMEKGMKRGIAQGMEQGIERGEARFAELTKKLMEQNRTEDIIRATSDPQFKITLYQEFGIE